MRTTSCAPWVQKLSYFGEDHIKRGSLLQVGVSRPTCLTKPEAEGIALCLRDPSAHRLEPKQGYWLGLATVLGSWDTPSVR
jgi:hypothetical protein